MATSVQVSKLTHQQLKKLKQKFRMRSYDEVIKRLIIKEEKIPTSMFGSGRRLGPFTQEEEAEFHEL